MHDFTNPKDVEATIVKEVRQQLDFLAVRHFLRFPILIGYYEPANMRLAVGEFAREAEGFDQTVIIFQLVSEDEIQVRVLARNRNDFEPNVEEVPGRGEVKLGDKLKWQLIGDLVYPIEEVWKRGHNRIIATLLDQRS